MARARSIHYVTIGNVPGHRLNFTYCFRTIHVTKRNLRTVLLATVAVTGVSGIGAQVILLRELLVSFLGNELSIDIILANWLILEAAGAITLGKIIEGVKRQVEFYIFLGLLSSLSFLPMIYFARIIRGIPGFRAAWGVGLGHIVLFPHFHGCFIRFHSPSYPCRLSRYTAQRFCTKAL